MKTKQTIRIKCDKNGREIAHYWTTSTLRWIKINLEEAKMLIATDQAWDHDAD